ncbi:spore germination protein [Paenibacillus sp. HJGM_3]|uniref:spore germination protein n=1 Tax=Paenibacillus sp. HJGM_3 TaxID=3379816 RepID=UPI00385E78C1
MSTTHSAPEPISPNVREARARLEEIFADCHDFTVKEWSYGPDLEYSACGFLLNTLSQNYRTTYTQALFQDLSPLKGALDADLTPDKISRFFDSSGVSSHTVQILDSVDQVVRNLTDGHIIILIDGWDHAISCEMPGVETRSVSEPTMEPVVFGPHNSTIEDLKTNIGLIRALIKTPRLKFKLLNAGPNCRREIVYGYISDIVCPDDLNLFEKRLSSIEDKDILDTTYLEEWVEPSVYSPFPQVRYTERPDVVTSALLTGKIIMFVQGSPTVMICPGLFIDFFSTSEDFYQRTVFSTLIRWLRLIAFVMAITLPSLYIALSTFHTELIPTVLLLAILDTREKIPFPAFVEALLMEFFFELLREAGIRLPRPIGSAVSIVGALVIGQAAIQAKIASPIMVIIVALTGIASFAMPQYNLAIALRVLRFPLMIMAATLGGFGLMIAYFLLLLHLTKLKSLSQAYLTGFAPLDFRRMVNELLVRAPIRSMLRKSRQRPGGVR